MAEVTGPVLHAPVETDVPPPIRLAPRMRLGTLAANADGPS